MKRFLFSILIFLAFQALGDNFRIEEGVKLISVSAGEAELEVRLSWANSWRNIYNYDAVYLFGKYRTDELSGWHHLFLSTEAGAQTVSEGYKGETVNGGRGIFVYRTTEDSGPASVTLRLKWNLAGNAAYPVEATDLSEGKVKFSLQGLEMVYVPTAPFYAGDGTSPGSFSSAAFGVFPPEYDLIGSSSNFTYSANGSESSAANAGRAADRYNEGRFVSSARHDWCGTVLPAYWTVDFKSERKILYFGVSGIFGEEYAAWPSGDWYLEGSSDNKTWSDLWHGGPEYWSRSSESYPVPQVIAVSRPGSYRYYRIRVDGTQNAGIWNNIRIANVAMTEADLPALASEGAVLVDGLSSFLPASYPNGVSGFYAMKYELSQEQYITFLNSLPRSAQYVRTIGGYLDKLSAGDYVFGGEAHRASHRNGIVVQEHSLNSGAPYLFGCNLEASDLSNGLSDGQTLACNYLSIGDLLSYAEWSGLRPLSELEYEKMCRGYYPVKPSGGEAAWESVSSVALTGIRKTGTEWESAEGENANVNTGGKLDGPVRAGIFVRGDDRRKAGNSFWGISDLSGNLSEIYCNVSANGRQLKRNRHGGGELEENGEPLAAATDWPREASAYGVRGGDYASALSELAVSDRSRATAYFSDLSERRPTVGIRLGYTVEPENSVSVLTLENGLHSGASYVYDTICGGATYTIRGDRPLGEDAAYQYAWYVSKDGGDTWTAVENGNNCDLEIAGLQEEIPPLAVRRYLYKRFFYAGMSWGQSGVVGLIVGYGYRLNRVRDTMQPCLASTGFEVQTPLPATFTWHCLDTHKALAATRETASGSYYQESTADLRINGRLDGGEYRIELTVSQAGGCFHRQELQILVNPWTSAPWDGNEVLHIDPENSDADLRQIENVWGGPDKQTWSITSALPGALTIDPNSGELHGMAQTMCNIAVSLTCADFPDRIYTKAIKEEFRDWYFKEPGAPRTLTLLPGRYKMECMGSQGGSHSEGGVGGLGGHVWGYIELTTVQQFHIYVGRTPYSPTSGGYNGGAGSQEKTLSSAGGGATDIRLTGGAWDDLNSLKSRIMVAGGGGSGGHSGRGGAGGGLSGGNGSATSGAGGRGGTQTEAGYSANASLPAGLGRGGVGYLHGGGGGGGYYGGGGGGTNGSANRCDHGGGGGSGYISGFPGCIIHSSGLRFENAGMESGVHEGKGYVRIEQL